MIILAKIFNFPAKKLRKNTGAYNTHAPLKKKLLVEICLKIFNFPAKKLRKNTGAYNTHAPF